LLSQENKQILQ